MSVVVSQPKWMEEEEAKMHPIKAVFRRKFCPVSQIESTGKASILDLKNSFSACHKVLLFFRFAKLEFVYLLKTAQ